MTWIEVKLTQLELGEYTFLLVVLTLVCVGLLYVSYTCYQRFRYIHGTATSKIRSASQGYVELKGLGEWMPGDQMFTPFSQQRCLWYHCTIEKKEAKGKRSSWTNILTKTSDQIFHLVDETGICVIDPEDAHVIPESSRTWYGQSPQDRLPPNTNNGFLFSQIASGNYRFTERIIQPASQIYVIGLFKTIQQNKVTDESIAKRVEDLIKHWKIQPDRYLSKYDIDENGIIQKHEWKLIKQQARKKILDKIGKENNQIHLINKPDDNSKPFILSALDEEQLVFRKKFLSYSTVFIAFCLFVIIVICINIRPLTF